MMLILIVFFLTSMAALSLSASEISGAFIFLLRVPTLLWRIVFWKD
jgi:hypothetical protein